MPVENKFAPVLTSLQFGGKLVIMRCVKCGTKLIPDKPFCHACGTRLAAECPSCGAAAEPDFQFCPDCGTRLAKAKSSRAAAPKPEPTSARRRRRRETDSSGRLGRLSRHMPEDLAAKIRAGSGAMEGERKLVTVLFCDLVGSTAIAEGLDPEEYRDLLDQYLELAIRQI